MPEEQAPEVQAAPGRDVFISYASQDAALASDIVETLERNGLRCWIAPRDVTPGAHYADAIILAISGAKALVLVLSDGALTSKHVGKEVERASSKGRPIIALRTGTAPLPPALEYFLSESQWIDVGAGGVAAVATKLVEAVRSHLDTAGAGDPRAHSGPPVARLGVAAPRRRWMWAAVVVGTLLACGLAYLMVDSVWRSKSAARLQPITAVPPASSVISEKSIAVLPFVDMSEKHDQEYFGDGMAEEILDLLVQIPELNVVGRTSSFQFKGRNEDLRLIGTRLNAKYVLEGSVRKAGSRIRVTAQLIDTRTGAHQWSQTFDRDFADVLKVQHDIAIAVGQAMRVVLSSPLPVRASLKDADAYQLYLKGMFVSEGDTEGHDDEAIAAFRASLAIDPNYAPAWVGLSYALEDKADIFGEDARGAYAAARIAAQRALDQDPKAVDGYLAMAWIYLDYDWDWTRAKEAVENARRLQPDNVRVLRLQSLIATTLGNWDDAVVFAREGVARDPLNPPGHEALANAQACRGDFSEAAAEYRRVLELDPESGVIRALLARALLLQGALAEALSVAQQEPNKAYQVWIQSMIYHVMGRTRDSDRALAEVRHYFPPGAELGIAWIYAARGELDDAFASFGRAYDRRETRMRYIKCMPEAPKFTRDPRYRALLRKMNLPE